MLAALLFLASVGVAQTTQVADPYATDPKAQFKKSPNTREVGPFFLTPRILVNSAGVDTNVNNSADAPIQDNSLTVTASLDVLLPIGRRARLLGYGGLSPNYFRDQQDARSVDRAGSLRAEVDVGPITPFAFVGAGRAKQRFSTEVDERLWRNESSYGFGIAGRATRKVTLTASGREQTSTYDDGVTVAGTDVKQALDRRNRTGTGEISYTLSKRTNLVARVEIMEDQFLSDPLAISENTVRSYRYLFGPSFTSASQIGGQILIGYRRFPSSATSAAPAYDGLALSGSLTLPLFGAGLDLTATRDVSYAVARSETIDGPARNTVVLGTYGLNTSIKLPLSLLMRPAVRLERASYLLPYPVAGGSAQRTDGTWSAGGGLLRRFGERIAVGGTIDHYWRSSNLSGFDYSGTRYGLTAEILP